MNLKNKKAQEEIVGFVLIILLVTIIALVFLGISIRKPVEKLPSSELESFLQASMRYSTDCLVSPERRYNLKDVIVSCAEINEMCLNGKSACQTLNETADVLLREGWNVCGDCPIKEYKFRVWEGNNRTLMTIKGGNCTGDRVFSQVFLHSYSGKITADLEICS